MDVRTNAALSALMDVMSLAVAARQIMVCAAMVTNGMAPCTMLPNCSLMSPRVFSSCFCLPASVFASCAFMLPTLAVITSASMAARSVSVPYCSTCFCVSSKVIPTRCSTSVCPCMAFPIMLPMLTASCVVAFSPSCCAMRLFMAGMSTSRLCFCLRKVAICWAPLNCTSSPMTPSSC